MKRLMKPVSNEDGAVLVLVAVSLAFLLLMAALAIDVGMLFGVRAEAQRAADAGALAGASVYMEELSPTEEGARNRAVEFATRNTLLGAPIVPEQVEVTFPNPNHVRVRVSTEASTWFARIFGARFNPVTVGAAAVARVATSGTSACVKPFGIPHDLYADSDGNLRNPEGAKLLIWESRSGGGGNNDKDDDVEAGYEAFLLVGDTDSSPGVGRDIYNMLTATHCPNGGVQVGDDIPAKPGNNTLGNVRGGLRELRETTQIKSDHLWSDAFNPSDFEGDPIIALIPTYKGVRPQGTGTVEVSGFLKVVIDPNFVSCQNNHNTRPDCKDPNATGQRQQVYARVYPATGVSDACTGAGCSETNFVLQLIQ